MTFTNAVLTRRMLEDALEKAKQPPRLCGFDYPHTISPGASGTEACCWGCGRVVMRR